MSLATYYHNYARNQGEGIRSQFGLHGAINYAEVHARSLGRHARADMLRAGREFTHAGVKFDGAKIPRDDKRESAVMDAARLADWADFYDMRFGPGSGRALIEMAKGTRADGSADGRNDAVVPMASQGLTYFVPEVYQIRQGNLPFWDEQFLKIDRRVGPAANEYVWYEATNVALARAANSYSITDIPMVNGPIASDNVGKIVPALVGYETNFMDPRREQFAVSQGKPDFQIERMKRESCERVLAEFANSLWFAGDGTLGIDGLFNNPIVETLSITGTWASKTALQILADLKAMAWAISNRTLGTLGNLNNVRIILPPDQYQTLMQPITSAGSASILEYFNAFFKDNKQGVPKVEYQYVLKSSNSYVYNGGPAVLARDTAILLYEEGNMDVDPTFVLSQPIEIPAPVRTTGVGDVTYYHMRCGGLKLPDAQRIQYVTGM